MDYINNFLHLLTALHEISILKELIVGLEGIVCDAI